MGNLIKKVRTHHHTTTCRKKKSAVSQFKTPWAPSDKRIVDEAIVNQSKKLTNKVLSYVVTLCDLSDVTQSELQQISTAMH